MPDLLQELAKQDVPPPPPELDRVVHERVNRTLLAGQLLEFAFAAIPLAAAHLARAIGGWLLFTLTGRYPQRPPEDR